MIHLRFFLFLLSLAPMCLIGTVDNDLVYGEGDIEVTSEISPYESLVANTPIQGTIMITHSANNLIETNSFRLGKQPLKVNFVSSTAMSSAGSIVVSIYTFQLGGLTKGTHTLPPITVNVSGKNYSALSLVVEVGD